MHNVSWLNALSPAEALAEFLQCCGSRRWAETMVANRPYASLEALIARGSQVWCSLAEADWLEAFRSHPRIGEKKTAQPVSPQSQQWSSQEQAGVQRAALEVRQNLATLNREYEEKFGFIFIVCATGKSSNEIMALLEQRLRNDATTELTMAAAEQSKITELRLRKLFSNS